MKNLIIAAAGILLIGCTPDSQTSEKALLTESFIIHTVKHEHVSDGVGQGLEFSKNDFYFEADKKKITWFEEGEYTPWVFNLEKESSKNSLIVTEEGHEGRLLFKISADQKTIKVMPTSEQGVSISSDGMDIFYTE